MQQLLLPLIHDLPSYEPADFIVSDANMQAYHTIRRWPEWPTRRVCLVGYSGCGKTHLLHLFHSYASTAQWVKIEDCVDNFPFTCDAPHIIIDNAHLYPDEVALMHLLNTIHARKGTALMASHKPPTEWNITLPDLRSRLLTMALCQVDTPDKQLLRNIFLKLCSDRQIFLSQDIIDYLLARLACNFENIRRIVDLLEQASAEKRRPVTRGLIRDIFTDYPHMARPDKP